MWTVKTTSKTKKLSLKQRRTIEPALRKHWKERERNPEPEKDRLKRTKTVSYFDRDALDGQRATIGRACSLVEQEEAIAETASKR